ncbi:hypothetical protein SAMN04490239_0086 [Rhodococcus koreensis]|uniref:Sigma-70, region 4 n=2 Tax=Rhodococcus koreensis TaxID=99653 RepID=A0A1H4I660_9NOCA|nr:hypothetical protein SAMN04490239_0086 [Rhodococcus koreensis]
MPPNERNPVMDDQKDAYTLQQQGLTWAEIGRELGTNAEVARSFAAAYERRTDRAAAEEQAALF